MKTIPPCPIPTGPAERLVPIFLVSLFRYWEGLQGLPEASSRLNVTRAEALQPCQRLCRLHVLPVLLEAALQVGFHQRGAETPPCPTAHAPLDADQDMFGFLSCQHTWPGHVQPLMSSLTPRSTPKPFLAEVLSINSREELFYQFPQCASLPVLYWEWVWGWVGFSSRH